MSLVFLIGLIGVLIAIFFKEPIIGLISNDHKFVRKFERVTWFHNHWSAGIFLFVLNAAIFFAAGLILFALTYFLIPFVHFVIMFFAVISCIFLWILFNKAWQGTKKNRVKMGLIGSSFYMVLTFVFVYFLLTMKPSYPGEDTFMGAIGLVFAIIITFLAFITCFTYTGFPVKKEIR
ncbi:hypothetical protein [Lentibacillus sp. Marseille-P4043]|uniref:hypothetical protein n=1 Tax=Lentibacillus sp. Marseille-P4043 TaxID=2040293 RepID=UPI003FA37A9B